MERKQTKEEKQKKREAALRANLKRRKAQDRLRETPDLDISSNEIETNIK